MPPLSFPIRQEVLEFIPYSPGLSINEIRQRYGLEQVIKLASNENPLGTSPLVQKVISTAAASTFRYAQSGNPRLSFALGELHGIASECIVTGNGSDEIIDLIIRVCPTPGKHSIVVAKPCFSLYKLQSKLCGVALREVPLNKDFSYNWMAMEAAVDATTALVFITMPDNPSGYCPPKKEVLDFVQSLPPSCLAIIDEAYIDFCTAPGCASLLNDVKDYPNLVVLRTFSKSYGLAGLRLGYGVMPKVLAAYIRTVRPPFSVNSVAEEAGLAAIEDTAFRELTFDAVHKGKDYLRSALAKLGCHVYPSQANFLMFSLCKTINVSGKDLFQKLLAKGVIIRPLDSYDLPGFLRVSIGTHTENHFFIEVLKEILTHE